MKVDVFDVEDLARIVCGLKEDADGDAVEMALFEKFEISFEQFHAVVEALMPYTIPARAAISGESFHGFVTDGAFIIKARSADIHNSRGKTQ